MKRTKIVCTIGPVSETKAKIEQMIKFGLNVARLNFSHGNYKHHAMLIKNIRSSAKKLDQPVAILQDLQGPRIRIGDVSKKGIKIKKGQEVVLTIQGQKFPAKGKLIFIPIQYANLYKDVKIGHPILIEDAKVELEVLKIKDKKIHCQVKSGEVINSHKGMNFPKSKISTPAITAKDKKDLEFGIKQGVDFVALSFVKDAKDIKDLRKLISRHEKKNRIKSPTKIIAKIERPEAVKNFKKILAEVDAIMIARGDLGLEIPLEKLPLIQKRIIKSCIKQAKPVIVATQMLDSMIRYPVPTRAEVTDVANAILDGTDAIMLSGETATGKYPLKAVRVMTKIANQVEKTEIVEYEKIEDQLRRKNNITENVSFAVQDVAEDLKVKLVVCLTASGQTARSISKFRTGVPVFALTPSMRVQNQLCLSWGVNPLYMPFISSLSQLIKKISQLLLKKKLVKKGDQIVIAAGHPFNNLKQTNLIKVETI